ncbi:MAG: NUDIX hydrolase [Pseudomonadota bacterium]|nr:NUDIX hydrolase [Pseudomonadota bacterium]MDE3037181.1 NUDIX hydrolase [Pseudomonadota bacterium]
MDIHAPIRAFLQQQSIVFLSPSGSGAGMRALRAPPSPGASAFAKASADMPRPPLPEGEGIIKAGVVPFLRDPLRFYLMKPVARHAGLPPPEFQICKGTRMMKIGGQWQDIVSSPAAGMEIESLAETALREGIEELGLTLENIRRLFDLGAYTFVSAKTGREKRMWLFAAEMASEEFSGEAADTTAGRGWLSFKEFMAAGRNDNKPILMDINNKLNNCSVYRP